MGYHRLDEAKDEEETEAALTGSAKRAIERSKRRMF